MHKYPKKPEFQQKLLRRTSEWS